MRVRHKFLYFHLASKCESYKTKHLSHFIAVPPTEICKSYLCCLGAGAPGSNSRHPTISNIVSSANMMSNKSFYFCSMLKSVNILIRFGNPDLQSEIHQFLVQILKNKNPEPVIFSMDFYFFLQLREFFPPETSLNFTTQNI